MTTDSKPATGTVEARVSPPFWTCDRVAAALGGLSDVNLPRGSQSFARVWTDTRTIQPGDLFVALIGERFDAHEYLGDAVAKGAAGLVVSRVGPACGLGVPVFEVRDTLVALGALGRARRLAWSKPVVGVVGTNGKTSTKELIRAALGSVFEVHATTGNLNNLVGVPLTLLAIPDAADVAVVEMGTNSPGEIARLRAIVEPTITVVTSIGEEHLEGLGDVEGVMREELAAADGVATVIVPADQPEVAAAAAAEGRAGCVVSAGLESTGADAAGSSLHPSDWAIEPDGKGTLTIDGVTIAVPFRGIHNLRNAMLAVATARALGVSAEAVARGLATVAPPSMRVSWEQHGRVTLINDAYNANPGSTRAALALLRHAGDARQRVAVLGTMLELGPGSPQLHEAIAREALGDGIDVIGAVGAFAAAFARVAPGDARVVAADGIEALWPALASRLQPDAIILLKGSRGMRLERLVAPIAEWAKGIMNGGC